MGNFFSFLVASLLYLIVSAGLVVLVVDAAEEGAFDTPSTFHMKHQSPAASSP